MEEIVPYSSRIKIARLDPASGTRGYSEVGISSNHNVPPPYYEFFQSMVLPKIVLPSNLNEVTPSRLTQQFVTFEPYYIASSRSVETGEGSTMTLADRWIQVANMITVNGVGLDALTWTDTLRLLRQGGHGGWLGSLLGDAAAAMTGVSALSTLGALIPF